MAAESRRDIAGKAVLWNNLYYTGYNTIRVLCSVHALECLYYIFYSLQAQVRRSCVVNFVSKIN